MLGQNDQGRPGLVQTWIHTGSNFDATAKRQPNMNAVAHFVGRERPLDLVDDFFPRWKFGERKRSCRLLKSIEVLVEFENSSMIKPETFPNRVATLNR